MDTIPVDVSVLDAKDRIVAWNRNELRLFKRPESVLGKDVRKCHPKKSLYKVERIIREMKDGTRDKAEFWIDLHGSKVSIRYFALRDKKGKYLGCLEVTQDVTPFRKLKGEKRLLD